MRPEEMDHLLIGTSGWNYPAGKGTWNGVFYPKPRPKGFDELAFYAEHFDTVEVNSTFYGQPRAEVCRAWADRTPARLRILGQAVPEVHASGDVNRDARQTPTAAPRCRARGGGDRHSARPTAADLDEFRRGIDPLASSGSSARYWRSFPPASRTTTDRASTSSVSCVR